MRLEFIRILKDRLQALDGGVDPITAIVRVNLDISQSQLAATEKELL
jgi:hypothetical protein